MRAFGGQLLPCHCEESVDMIAGFFHVMIIFQSMMRQTAIFLISLSVLGSAMRRCVNDGD